MDVFKAKAQANKLFIKLMNILDVSVVFFYCINNQNQIKKKDSFLLLCCYMRFRDMRKFSFLISFYNFKNSDNCE